MQVTLPIAEVVAWTDGSVKSNSMGGWGAILVCDGEETLLSGHEMGASAQRMEVMAACRAIQEAPPECPIRVVSDSQYVVNSINEWLQIWAGRGWEAASGKIPAHLDLWRLIHAEMARRIVTARWVKGHSGVRMNERVDRLAGDAAYEGLAAHERAVRTLYPDVSPWRRYGD